MFELLKIIIKFLIVIIGILFAIAVIRTLILPKEAIHPCEDPMETKFVASDEISNRLAKALTFQTISYEPRMHNGNELKKFANFIVKSFPNIHSVPFIKKEVVNKFSLLYTVKGQNPQLKPYMLAAHMDVVPVVAAEWDLSPFSGKIENGYINGRGAIDDKDMVLGILEALEFLIKSGFRPQRSFFLAFGHDEEIHGYNGAAYISKLLTSRNVQLEYLLDEGTFIMEDFIPGMPIPTAFVSVSEKGRANIRLSVNMEPGHSAAPPTETAILVLAKAITKLPSNIFPSLFGSEMDYKFFETIAPYATLPFRFIYSNLWLFRPAISWVMCRNHLKSALLKTTIVTTVISGGLKTNVVPSNASAILNLRIHPLQSIDEVMTYISDIINDDRINIEVVDSASPHPISPFSDKDFGYATIKNSIHAIHQNIVVIPTVLMANTDTLWYRNLTDAIYRFSPVELKPHELSRFHGHNEKILVSNYMRLVHFYMHLIKNSDKTELSTKHKHQEL